MSETVIEDETESERDVAEFLRIGVILAGLALNVWIMWDYIREQPEWQVTKRRISQWWQRVVVAPEKAAAKLRKMERETVFEAIQVVDDAGS